MIKNKLYILLIAFLAMGLQACSDDDKVVIEGEDNPDRLFMPMFRSERNGVSTSDRYYSGVANGAVNDIQLYWYGVNGASGYHVKGIVQGRDWNRPSDLILDTIVGPEVLNLRINDLQYLCGFRFAIQALSPKGDAYNSKWFGMGDGAHPDDYLNIETLPRYDVPEVLWVEGVTESSFRVRFNLNSDGKYSEHFEEENGKYVMDQIKIEPSADNPDLEAQVINLTEADKNRGYIDVDGLVTNSVYVVNGLNNKVKRYWDRLYNTNMVRMKGEVGEPILLKHVCDPNDVNSRAVTLNACRIDTILANYMQDNTLAEGTIFELEPKKVYYCQNTVNMSKGFTLRCSDPNVSEEDRPTLYLGIGYKKEVPDPNDPSGEKKVTYGVDDNVPGVDVNESCSCNFSFGRNANLGEMGGINVQSITFQNINFDCDKAYNYLNRPSTKGSGLGNYFINQSSQAMPFSLASFEVRDCNFRHMIRGWIRFQGPNRKIVERFIVDNCLFADCGVYDANGRGYAWINGDSKVPQQNIWNNFSMTNCTFIDSPWHALLSDKNNLAWPTTTTWNVRIENNTFVNFSTRSKDRLLIEMNSNPSNSKFTCKKNLFVIVRKDKNDQRKLFASGMRAENAKGCVYDFADNYATVRVDFADNKMNKTDWLDGKKEIKITDYYFTSNQFSHTSRGANRKNGEVHQNLGGADETKIKLGVIPIEATELFEDPLPKSAEGEKDMHSNYNLKGFYYRNTDKVHNHEIYKNNIGDPRWRR